MQNRSGERVGADAPASQKILKDEVLATPISDRRGGAPVAFPLCVRSAQSRRAFRMDAAQGFSRTTSRSYQEPEPDGKTAVIFLPTHVAATSLRAWERS